MIDNKIQTARKILFLSFTIFISCSSNSGRKEIDYENEFQNGKIALAKKKYIKAQDYFNTVVIGASHTELGDDALFYLGESFFYSKDYLIAISEYDRLIRRMPFSPFIEKARYRICEAYLILSPKYFNDQTYSEKALEKLQEFIDDYPGSSERQQAEADIKILRNKLSEKAYQAGILYMKMEEYKAALLAFKQVIELYYDTEYIEMANLKTIACYIERNEIDLAKNYYQTNRISIEDINMDDLVDEWFVQGRVFDRIELE
ncbi:MAG: outer membrane protein assembly factor BamD [Candidatus Neomarinimicrobiota bacterium]